MRSDDYSSNLALPKTAVSGLEFYSTLPAWTIVSLTDSLGLTDPANIDADVWSTGLLRVVNVGNVLYYQNVTNINSAWPAWTNTGISLRAGSIPVVDGGYVWYHKADNSIAYRYFGSWGTEVVIANYPLNTTIAATGNRGYGMTSRTGRIEIKSLHGQDSQGYYLYGLAALPTRMDAVSYGGYEYLYVTDRDAGRVVEIKHSGAGVSGKDTYGVGHSVIPIDAIDDVYGFKLGAASVIGGKVVVTGRLTRTSDGSPITYEIYSFGPERFSQGRESFLQDVYNINGKLLLIGTTLVYAGAQRFYKAASTIIFGSVDATRMLQTTNFHNFSLTEAESRSPELNIEIPASLSHVSVGRGQRVRLSYGYQQGIINEALLVGDYHITDDQLQRGDTGDQRTLSAVGKSSHALTRWSPDQGVYIPSQATAFDYPSRMAKVIRAKGRWSSVTPGSSTSAIKLDELNSLGVLYSTARASRGGSMRAKFYYPSDSYFTPYFGVVINYYQETAAEAAARLGVTVSTLDEALYGHNGIAAIYSPTEHSGGPGISINVWTDNVLTKLTSVSFTIPANTWVWMEVQFVEGEIRVKYRADSSATWVEKVTQVYNHAARAPWKRETLGRGAVIVKNVVPETPCYPLADGDVTLGVDANSAFPTSGTIRVDSEDITYNGKSSATPPADFTPAGSYSKPPGWTVAPQLFWIGNDNQNWDVDGTFNSLGATLRVAVGKDSFSYDGTASGYHALDQADHTYDGLAMVFVPTSQVYGYKFLTVGSRTCRLVAWDRVANRAWVPTNALFASGWKNYIGDGSKGAWVNFTDPTYLYGGAFTDQDVHQWASFTDNPFETIGNNFFKGWFCLRRALYLTGRGANGTVATSHGLTTAYYNPGKYVSVELVGSFTQDEDQSLDDGLRTIAALAGTSAETDLYNSYVNFTGSPITLSDVGNKNIIASVTLPSSMTNGKEVGCIFRVSSSVFITGGLPQSSQGYYLSFKCISSTSYFLRLYNLSTQALIEEVPWQPTAINATSTPVPGGDLKISVQGDLFSVWLNGRYIHTFQNATYPTGNSAGYFSTQATAMFVRFSKLCDLIPDVIVGTRGNGMSVISELIADRHIFFRETEEGDIFFYRDKIQTSLTVPDAVYNITEINTDEVVTRVRAEGIAIAEKYDSDAIQTFGNYFSNINARHANDITETETEATHAISESWFHAHARRYAMLPYLTMQPGDVAVFPDERDGSQILMTVISNSVTAGFFGEQFQCEAQVMAVRAERD